MSLKYKNILMVPSITDTLAFHCEVKYNKKLMKLRLLTCISSCAVNIRISEFLIKEGYFNNLDINKDIWNSAHERVLLTEKIESIFGEVSNILIKTNPELFI